MSIPAHEQIQDAVFDKLKAWFPEHEVLKEYQVLAQRGKYILVDIMIYMGNGRWAAIEIDKTFRTTEIEEKRWKALRKSKCTIIQLTSNTRSSADIKIPIANWEYLLHETLNLLKLGLLNNRRIEKLFHPTQNDTKISTPQKNGS